MTFKQVVHSDRTEETGVTRLQVRPEGPIEHPQECPSDAAASRGNGAVGAGSRIVYEPTRPCHRAFERRLADAGGLLVKGNPRQGRRFAEATGMLARTAAPISTAAFIRLDPLPPCRLFP